MMSWGLGIEHEMLFGVDARDRGPGTWVIPSARVVRVVDAARIKAAYAAMEPILGKLPHPECRVRVTLSGTASGTWSLFPTRAKKADLKAVSDENLHTFLECEYPFVCSSQSAFVFGWRMLGWSGEGAWKVVDTLNKILAPALDELHRRTGGPRAMRRFVRAILSGSAENAAMKRFEAAMVAAIAEVIPALDVVRKGTVVEYSGTTYDASMVTVGRGPRIGATDLLRSIASVPSCPSTGRNETALELDGEFVEVKTMRFASARVEALLAELAFHESVALGAARTLDPTARILPHSGYADVVYVNDDGQQEKEQPQVAYAGSYHFWFTLPHDPASYAPTDAAAFTAAHAAFAHRLQWLEPLLLACTGGDPRAIGAGTAYPRANMRGTLNNLASSGTVDACGPYFGVSDRAMQGPLPVYASEAAFVRGDLPTWTSRVEARFKERVGKMERWVPFLGCRATPRNVYSGMYRGVPQFPLDRRPGHNRLLPPGVQLLANGNDVRAEWCPQFERPMAPGWTAFLVPGTETGAPLEVRFAKGAKWRSVFPDPPARQPPPSFVGFEFRIMDNMPHSALPPLLRLFVLVAAASNRADTCSGPIPAAPPLEDPDWAAALASVVAGGQFAACPPAYLRKLWALLMPAANPPSTQVTAWGALSGVCEGLHALHADHPWTKLLFEGVYPDPPVLEQTNLAAWRDAFGDRRAPSQKARKSKAWELDRPYLEAVLSTRV